jgi:hypothetical protein
LLSCDHLSDPSQAKLKELGNGLLGMFGMKLDDFKFQQDPATGGYSLKVDKK